VLNANYVYTLNRPLFECTYKISIKMFVVAAAIAIDCRKENPMAGAEGGQRSQGKLTSECLLKLWSGRWSCSDRRACPSPPPAASGTAAVSVNNTQHKYTGQTVPRLESRHHQTCPGGGIPSVLPFY